MRTIQKIYKTFNFDIFTKNMELDLVQDKV
jgi:hypothetical protein